MDDLAGASGSWIHDMGGVFLPFTPFADITSLAPRTLLRFFGLRWKAPRESSNIIIHASILLISRLVLFCFAAGGINQISPI
ncbi:hypothetical protein HDK77DRAFT_433929 [Phyllosticta capitalensis]